jgi:branched-subunit amino acid aminotransferase/4-amino-4-deoxychorismate lyase
VVRGLVMDTARVLGLTVVEEGLTPERLAAADALFLTSSLIGIWAVRELGGLALDPCGSAAEVRAAVLEAAFRP